jgi:hypothetical protein
MGMKRSATAAAVALLAGCTGGINGACTLIGCQSGLTVNLAQAPAGSYSIEVFTPSSQNGAHYVFQCASAASCGTTAFFAEFTPASVVVRITTETGGREEYVTPSYQKSRPNGPNCGPECIQATVTVALP